MKCCHCNCPKNELQNPLYKPKLIKASDTTNPEIDEVTLKEKWSMYKIENAFFKLNIGHCPSGPAGLFLAEILHVVQLGYEAP